MRRERTILVVNAGSSSIKFSIYEIEDGRALRLASRLFGDGELYRLFFRWRSSQAKLTRRQRIRLLTRLSRLTEVNAIEVFKDPGSAAHAELVEIVRALAAPPVATPAR